MGATLVAVSDPSATENGPPPAAARNLPQFEDMPIEPDTANLGEGVGLDPLCGPFAPLVGVWRGIGEAVYPTLLGGFFYGQQVTFAHDGRPFLFYEARAWLINGAGEVLKPAARELGWWRVDEDEGVEVVLVHHFGICEIYYGGATSDSSWELHTDTVSRTETARETTEASRQYALSEDGGLVYTEDRALRGQPMAPHLAAQLERVAG